MGKYMKYEIKGTYKNILAILAVVLIAVTVVYGYAAKQSDSAPLMMLVIFGTVIFGTFLTAFIYIIESFKRELYEDRGYLTFTLPLTGNQIVGAKLLVALMWFVLLAVVTVLYNVFMIIILPCMNINLSEIFSAIDKQHISMGLQVMFSFVILFMNGIMTLILIYFSMTLSRVTLRNKKIGGIWFVIFLVLRALVGYGLFKAMKVVPYYLDLSTFKVVAHDIVTKHIEYSSYMGSYMTFNEIGAIISVGGKTFVNIASIIYTIAISIIAFLGTGYLIENKIDL